MLTKPLMRVHLHMPTVINVYSYTHTLCLVTSPYLSCSPTLFHTCFGNQQSSSTQRRRRMSTPRQARVASFGIVSFPRFLTSSPPRISPLHPWTRRSSLPVSSGRGKEGGSLRYRGESISIPSLELIHEVHCWDTKCSP
jgi:hypothetical protein